MSAKPLPPLDPAAHWLGAPAGTAAESPPSSPLAAASEPQRTPAPVHLSPEANATGDVLSQAPGLTPDPPPPAPTPAWLDSSLDWSYDHDVLSPLNDDV